nr:helix-turn-helix domain-containing protein [Clostridium tyrobutyricum]
MFKDKLRELRKNNNLTQSQLGKIIGVSGAYIQQLEKGIKKNPSLEVILKICNEFNVDPIDLIESNSELLKEFTQGYDNDEKRYVYDTAFSNELDKITNLLESKGYDIIISSHEIQPIKILKDNNIVSEMLEVDFVNYGNDMLEDIDKFTRFTIEEFLKKHNIKPESKDK